MIAPSSTSTFSDNAGSTATVVDMPPQLIQVNTAIAVVFPAQSSTIETKGGERMSAYLAKPSQAPHPLRIQERAFEQIFQRMSVPNQDNPDFEGWYRQLEGVLRTVTERLRDGYGDQVEWVFLMSDELTRGVRSDKLSYYGTDLYILLSEGVENTDELYEAIIHDVFSGLDASIIRLQIHLLLSWKEWQRMEVSEALAAKSSRTISLLSR